MLTVRRLGEEDVEAYRAIRLEALERAPEAFGSTLAREQAFSRADFLARLTGGTVFGAFEGLALAGIAGLVLETREKQRHKGTLFGMYVRPGVRGHGVGRALVEAVLTAADGVVEQVLLAVVEGNAGARQLYESCGFSAYGVEPRALKFGGQYFDEVLMVCPLVAMAEDRVRLV
jgi:GNAT superfamily N-acetyltransferase